MSFKEEFKWRTTLAGFWSAGLSIFILKLAELLKPLFCPGDINKWISVETQTPSKAGLFSYIFLAAIAFCQTFMFASGSLRRPFATKGIIAKFTRISVVHFISTMMV